MQKDLTNNSLFRKTIAPYVPRYHKLIKTNKGLGLVTDLIYDDNNHLSLRLADFILASKPIPIEIKGQFNDFFSRLLKYHLWFYDFDIYMLLFGVFIYIPHYLVFLVLFSFKALFKLFWPHHVACGILFPCKD